MPTLTPAQKEKQELRDFMLSRIPAHHYLPKKFKHNEPEEIKTARQTITAYEEQCAAEDAVRALRIQRLAITAKEAVYTQSHEEALDAIHNLEAAMAEVNEAEE